MAGAHGKRYLDSRKLVEKGRTYELSEAVSLLKKMKGAKFDETVDVAMLLNVDPRKAEQLVRGMVNFPHGSGKVVRLLVFADGEYARQAGEAGADFVGSAELIEKISSGWTDFDVALATPDMMKSVAKLGRILGPRGLMPSSKAKTVTTKLAEAIKEIKAGRAEFRVDKGSGLHLSVGKLSFNEDALVDNIKAFFKAVIQAKPPSLRGLYIKSGVISSAMGAGVRLNVREEVYGKG